MPHVHDDGVLDGLADVPWADLTHAYGPAEDVPGLLRAVASGDARASRDTVHELFGNIWHQRTVYRATPYAVPFLARMAAAGIAAAGVLSLLGCIAESTDDVTGGSARAAVAAQAGLLVPLLRDADPQVRGLAAWTLAQSRAGEEAFAAVQAQWAAEKDPVVRPTLLKAMAELTPARVLPLAAAAAASGASAGERLVGAWACVTAGRPWDDELRSASLAWLSEGLDLENGWWGDSNSGPFACLLCDLAERGDFTAAVALALDSLALATIPGTLAKVVWDVEQFTDQYRVPVPALTAALERLTPDPQSAREVKRLLSRLRPAPPVPAASAQQAAAGTLSPAGIREGLASERGMLRAALAARTLGSPPGWLVPALKAALDSSARYDRPNVETRIEVARTLWHFTGDAATVIPVIAEGLQSATSRFRNTRAQRAAAEAAADLGPAAAPLIPRLLPLLEDPACCPAAAHALLRADPDAAAIPLTDLGNHLATAAGAPHVHVNDQAMNLLRDIHRRDPTAVSEHDRARLRDIADSPRRVIRAGSYDEIIRQDEALRLALHDLLRDLGHRQVDEQENDSRQ